MTVTRKAIAHFSYEEMTRAMVLPDGNRVVGVVPQSAQDVANEQITVVIEGVDCPKCWPKCVPALVNPGDLGSA